MLEHEDVLITWSRERGARVRGAAGETVFSVDRGGDDEHLVATATGCELWVSDRGPRSLSVRMSSVLAAEKYLLRKRAAQRRRALGLARWPHLDRRDPVAEGADVTWGDTTTVVSWSDRGRHETIEFLRPRADEAVTLSYFVRPSVDDLIRAIESPAAGKPLGMPLPASLS